MSLALEPTEILQELRPPRDSIRRRLAQLRSRVRREIALEGLAWTAAAGAFVFLATLAADWWFRFNLATRLTIAVIAAAALLALAWIRLVRPMLARLPLLDLAMLVDRAHPGFSQRVAAVFELPELIADRIQASPGMVRAAVLEHAQALGEVDWTGCLDRRRSRRHAAILIAAIALPAAFVLAWPHVGTLWLARWCLGSNVRWPQHNYLALLGAETGAPLFVPRGEAAIVQIDAQPKLVRDGRHWRLPGRDDVWLAVASAANQPGPRPEIPTQIFALWQPDEGPAKQISLARIGEARFRGEIPAVTRPLELHLRGGDDWFGPVRIEPLDRPTLERLTLTARRPGETEAESVDAAQSQLLFLPRTELELSITARQPLAEAALKAQSGTPPLERVDARTFVARWSMRESLTLEIHLTGQLEYAGSGNRLKPGHQQSTHKEGGLRSKPYFVSIGLLVDRPPRVTLQSSGVGRRITPQARVPLMVRAADDFGLTGWSFETEQLVAAEGTQSKSTRIEIELPQENTSPLLEADHRQTIAVSELGISTGGTLKLRGSAADNCAEGSQTGVSRWLTFQVVTPEELFYDILMRQRALRAKFRQAFEASQAQAEALAGPLAAEDAVGLARKHQTIARQVADVSRQLAATHEEMTLNDLGSPAARDLMQARILDPLAMLAKSTLVEQRARLESLVADEPSEALRTEAAEAQGRIAAEMESILKQMSQWESFVDVVNQLKQIIKLQTGVLEATEAERKKKTGSVFDD